MNNRILKLAVALFLTALLARSEKVVASSLLTGSNSAAVTSTNSTTLVVTPPSSSSNTSSHGFAYTDSLTNLNLVSSNFTSYTTVDSDYINNPSGGWFVIDTNYGLELLSTNPNYVEGLATYNRLLQASNDWTITIQSHITAFTNNQTNPYYSAGISLIHTTTNGLEYPNRVDLNLVRTGLTGSVLSNSIVSSLFINNGETDTTTDRKSVV